MPKNDDKFEHRGRFQAQGLKRLKMTSTTLLKNW